MSSAWPRVFTIEPASLTSVMTEEEDREKAKKQAEAEANGAYQDEAAAVVREQDLQLPDEDDDDEYKNDAEIASTLQKQYDKEYHRLLQVRSDKLNKNSKVSISFEKYRRTPLNAEPDSDDEEVEDEEDQDDQDWDRFDGVQRDYEAIRGCGYSVKDGVTLTKHDDAINGRRNACKMMSFPTNIETGDGAGFDLQLSNRVFNSLRLHSKHLAVRQTRANDKKEASASPIFGVDMHTDLLLYSLITGRTLTRLNGEVSVGKEALILHGERVAHPKYDNAYTSLECAVKIYKTTVCEYKTRNKYIRDDTRFKDRISKLCTKNSVHLWAEKEMRNLIRLRLAHVPVPRVIKLKENILVMSFIGRNQRPARKLKEALLTDGQWLSAYHQVLKAMKAMYADAKLIHADLSGYNILWFEGICYFIDVSQAVEPDHDNAYYFLMRDCKNMHNFFTKRVRRVLAAEDMFRAIVGCNFNERIDKVLKYFKSSEDAMLGPENMNAPDNFDAAWASSQCQSSEHEPKPSTSAEQ